MIATDIEKRYSGGVANSDPDLSLGDVMSSEVIPSNTLGNLFDNVTEPERTSGTVEYRCFYFVNTHATETLPNASIFIASQTPSAGTAVAIGLDAAGVGDGATTGVAETIPDETTPPASVAFSAPTNAATGLSVGNLAPGDAIALWVRRTVDPGTAARATDPFTIAIAVKP